MTTTSRFTDPTKAVFRNARLLRLQRGWTAQKLADLLTEAGRPTARSVVAKQEKGFKQAVTVDMLFALAHVFEVPIDALTGDGPLCQNCNDTPPAGYQCNLCGLTSHPSR
ncbi:helix-turn-helix transcriptional regulator [Nonomuraea sp. K274]|uniref:Helix-turn-helix transcriptional regulator n=1 Tax=Nonomuraea cypriaca TaxID=1187855 RepID=A0A931EYH1_9ACTN|nr:helix-turn-helix domain-containing protein [Nonomuraea cypriaca]MBF8187310.1 helix-turn-helix transcriptional regulator [Nonomuraea cypriaca]